MGKFYIEARTKSGEVNNRRILFNIRHAINRFIQSKTDFNIIKDDTFKSCNRLFLAAAKDLKRNGKGAIDHHPPVETEDMRKIYSSFLDNLNYNNKLQEKVLFDIMLYFGRRGRENFTKLKISDFSCT